MLDVIVTGAVTATAAALLLATYLAQCLAYLLRFATLGCFVLVGHARPSHQKTFPNVIDFLQYLLGGRAGTVCLKVSKPLLRLPLAVLPGSLG